MAKESNKNHGMIAIPNSFSVHLQPFTAVHLQCDINHACYLLSLDSNQNKFYLNHSEL